MVGTREEAVYQRLLNSKKPPVSYLEVFKVNGIWILPSFPENAKIYSKSNVAGSSVIRYRTPVKFLQRRQCDIIHILSIRFLV